MCRTSVRARPGPGNFCQAASFRLFRYTSGQAWTLRCAASRISCASMLTRVSAAPSWQIKSIRPLGGSGHVHQRESPRCVLPTPPPKSRMRRRLFVAGGRWYVADDLAAVGELQADRHGLVDYGAVLPPAGRPSSVFETRAIRTHKARHDELETVVVSPQGGDRYPARLSLVELQDADWHQDTELRFGSFPWVNYPALQRGVRWRSARQAHGISLSPPWACPPERRLTLDNDKRQGPLDTARHRVGLRLMCGTVASLDARQGCCRRFTVCVSISVVPMSVRTAIAERPLMSSLCQTYSIGLTSCLSCSKCFPQRRSTAVASHRPQRTIDITSRRDCRLDFRPAAWQDARRRKDSRRPEPPIS